MDQFLSESLLFHIELLSQRIPNIESLQDLHLVLGKKVPMVAASLAIKKGEGGPAGVIIVEGSFKYLLS